MLIILGIIIICFVGLYTINTLQTNQAMENNPFGKDDLHPLTVRQLTNPHYQNIILPDELEAQLATEETMFVYFYSPDCSTCRDMSPVIVPTAEELGIDLKLLNLLEFPEAWTTYRVPSTPTVAYFEEGQPHSAITGKREKEAIEKWFSERLE